MIQWTKFELSPRFYEVDSYHRVNHIFYLSWMEMGRFVLAEKAGILIPRIQEEEIAFVVSEVAVRYKKAIGFLDRVTVETVLLPVKNAKLTFKHQIRAVKDRSLLAEGKVATICLRRGQMQLKLPDWIMANIQNFIEIVQKGYPDEE